MFESSIGRHYGDTIWCPHSAVLYYFRSHFFVWRGPVGIRLIRVSILNGIAVHRASDWVTAPYLVCFRRNIAVYHRAHRGTTCGFILLWFQRAFGPPLCFIAVLVIIYVLLWVLLFVLLWRFTNEADKRTHYIIWACIPQDKQNGMCAQRRLGSAQSD